MKQIFVYSRADFVAFQSANWAIMPNYAVISIASVGDINPSILSSNALCLHFNDVNEGDKGAMTLQEANLILSFAERNKDKNIIVHCDAGLSRSPAVALALSELGYGSYNPAGKFPNVWVKSLVKRAAWNKLFA